MYTITWFQYLPPTYQCSRRLWAVGLLKFGYRSRFKKTKKIHLIMLVCLMIQKSLASEPTCSKFPYEEAMLEKMVRTEYQFGLLQTAFTDLQEDVKTKLKEMSADIQKIADTAEASSKDMRRERDEINAAFADLNKTTLEKIGEFMEENQADVEQQGRELIVRLSTDLEKMYKDLTKNLTESLATPIISFTATGVKDDVRSVWKGIRVIIIDGSAGDVLVFPRVMTNTGSGYNPSTGVFTAPLSGLYLLNVQVCTQRETYFSVQILVNGKEVGRVYSWDSDTYDCNSGTAVAQMKAGGTASVKALLLSGKLLDDSYRLVAFSGALMTKAKGGN